MIEIVISHSLRSDADGCYDDTRLFLETPLFFFGDSVKKKSFFLELAHTKYQLLDTVSNVLNFPS